MSKVYDYIIIGSGFGGSVMTHRLTEKGYSTCLLERGSEYPMQSFPRRVHETKEKLFWEPEKEKYGYMEVRDDASSDFLSVTGSGLGGGSLIYANVLLRLQKEYFEGWPFNINAEALEEHYLTVLDMMDATPYPFGKDKYYSDTPKTKLYRETAERIEIDEDMLEKPKVLAPDLAINFKGEFPGEQSLNKHGKVQSKCNKCGECDIGCNIHAKNTLDLNYLHLARKNGAEIRTSAEVTDIIKKENTYLIKYVNPISKETFEIESAKVVVSAGAIGSTRLLLAQKDKGNLPNLSQALGKNICGNGDFLAYSNNTKETIDPTKGPVITTAIEYKMTPYPDGYKHVMYLEDAGAPIGLAWYLAAKIPQPKMIFKYINFLSFTLQRYFKKVFKVKQLDSEVNLGEEFSDAIDSDQFVRNMFVHLAMGRDRHSGHMVLEDGEYKVRWNIADSKLHFDRVKKELKKYTKKWKGTFMENPFMHTDKIFAVHPLGGCIMHEDPTQGVINEDGEAYNYEGLYVVDGSIIPNSLGPNPSLTIAAMAERIASRIPEKV
jgi:cholesterol oxidase